MGRPGRQRDQVCKGERGGYLRLEGRSRRTSRKEGKDSTRKQPSKVVSLSFLDFIVNSDWTDSCQFSKIPRLPVW